MLILNGSAAEKSYVILHGSLSNGIPAQCFRNPLDQGGDILRREPRMGRGVHGPFSILVDHLPHIIPVHIDVEDISIPAMAGDPDVPVGIAEGSVEFDIGHGRKIRKSPGELPGLHKLGPFHFSNIKPVPPVVSLFFPGCHRLYLINREVFERLI
jgi:hypothetical protein